MKNFKKKKRRVYRAQLKHETPLPKTQVKTRAIIKEIFVRFRTVFWGENDQFCSANKT
jgi:hypothetical protein